MHQPARKVTSKKDLFTKKNLLLTTTISLIYLLISKLLIGFKTEQLVLVIIFNVLFYLSFKARLFIKCFSVFLVFWIIFDFMKGFPNYLYNTVHIESLYKAEKYLFGVRVNSLIVTPNEYWRYYSNTFLDIMSGVFYLCWVPVPMLFTTYLFFSKRYQQLMHFTLTFLFVNLLGFVIYYIYPAAPPWYVQNYGFKFIANTPGNTAGLQRFDIFFNAPVFKSLYAKSSNVFAAMPSLHSSYPLITFYYGIKNRLGNINYVFAIIMVGIWFAAIYTSHHYLLDVLAGIACAITGIFIFQRWIAPNAKFQSIFIDKFLEQ